MHRRTVWIYGLLVEHQVIPSYERAIRRIVITLPIKRMAQQDHISLFHFVAYIRTERIMLRVE